jgi:DNA-binding HxlR family transcriptional regulator
MQNNVITRKIEGWPSERVCASDTRSLVREILTRIGDKWTIFVIVTLSPGPMRFTKLMTEIPGISHRMLTKTLRTLERDGLVTRTVYPEVPPRVEYELTPLGRTLTIPLDGVLTWVESKQDEIEESRRRFEG